MEAHKIIDNLKKQLDMLLTKDEKNVSIVALNDYLDKVKEQAEQSNEIIRLDHECNLADFAANTEWGTQLLNAVLEAGKSALHSLIIINGGAVIALMGILSNLVGKPQGKALAGNLSLPLLLFGIGVLCGGLGFAFRYFSQDCYTNDFGVTHSKYRVGGHIFKYLAIFCALGGFTIFGWAILNSYYAFSSAF